MNGRSYLLYRLYGLANLNDLHASVRLDAFSSMSRSVCVFIAGYDRSTIFPIVARFDSSS